MRKYYHSVQRGANETELTSSKISLDGGAVRPAHSQGVVTSGVKDFKRNQHPDPQLQRDNRRRMRR